MSHAIVLRETGGPDKLRAANGLLLLLGLALFIFGIYLRAFRWRALLADRGQHVPILKLTQLYFIG